MIAFFFRLFEGYKCNRMYEITPNEKILMGPEKTNFSDHELQLTNWNLTHEVTEDLTATSLAWENSWHLATRPLVSRAAKWRVRNERWNSILMTRHCPDLGSASDWLNQIPHAARPIRSTPQIWVARRHQYGISALISRTSIGGKTNGSFAKCRLFSQSTISLQSSTTAAFLRSGGQKPLYMVTFFCPQGGRHTNGPWKVSKTMQWGLISDGFLLQNVCQQTTLWNERLIWHRG